MSLVDNLRFRADGLSDEAERVRLQIADLEAELVRAQDRLRLLGEQIVEARVAANILEQRGLRVWTDENGAPNVAVDETA